MGGRAVEMDGEGAGEIQFALRNKKRRWIKYMGGICWQSGKKMTDKRMGIEAHVGEFS